MRIVTVQRSAAGISSWTVDKDCLFQQAQFNNISGVVSKDPALVESNMTAPTVNQVLYDVMALAVASGNFPTMPLSNAKIPLSAGETVYVRFSGAGSALLLLDDMPPE
jgi:hypothetical protein